MFIVICTIVALAGFLIYFKVSEGYIDADDVKFSIIMTMLCATVSLLLSMMIVASITSNSDNCDIKYTEYEVVKTDDVSSAYIIVKDSNRGVEYAFTYVNDDGMFETASLRKSVNVVYSKDTKPTCIRKTMSLKPQYNFWFISWDINEYTLLLSSHECVFAN